MQMPNQTLREKLAEYAHQAWSGWMKYLFDQSCNVDGIIIIPKSLADEWARKAIFSYKVLSEQEKESDRLEADKIIKILQSDYDEMLNEAEKEK